MDWTARSLLSSSICWARRTSRRQVGHRRRPGSRGCTPRDEAELGGVHVADAGQPGLVEQRLADRRGRARSRSRRSASSSSQSGPSRSGPRWPTTSSSRSRGEQLDDAEREADRRRRRRSRARPGPGVAGRGHRSPGLVDPPGALHLEVGVQRPAAVAAVDPGEQVLAAGDGLGDGGAGQVGGGELRHPEVGARSAPARSARGRAAGPRGRRCRPQARSLSPLGRRRRSRPRRAPRAAGSSPPPSSCSPSAFSTVSRPSAPRRAASASDCGRRREQVGVVGPGEQGAAAALDVERERAVDQDDQRAGLAPGPVAAARRSSRSGQGSAAPYGLAGSVAASATASGLRRVGRRTSAKVRSRSIAPAVPNWAAPRPSTK